MRILTSGPCIHLWLIWFRIGLHISCLRLTLLSNHLGVLVIPVVFSVFGDLYDESFQDLKDLASGEADLAITPLLAASCNVRFKHDLGGGDPGKTCHGMCFGSPHPKSPAHPALHPPRVTDLPKSWRRLRRASLTREAFAMGDLCSATPNGICVQFIKLKCNCSA